MRPGEPTHRFLSIGMGTQSCALALMSAAGDLPKLDAVIFADTLRAAWERAVDDGQGDLFDGAALGLDCSAGVCFT